MILGLYIVVLLPTCLYFAGCIVGWATAFDALKDTVAYIEICICILQFAFIVYLYLLNASENQYVVVSDTSIYVTCFFGAAMNFLLGITSLCPKTCSCCVTDQSAGNILFFAYAAAVVFCLVVAIYLLATKMSFLLRVYSTSFDENCGTACLEALQQQCAAPSHAPQRRLPACMHTTDASA